MEFKERKSLRSVYIDYSAAGAYFVTICTKDKKKLFWDMSKFNPQFVAESFSKSVGAISNRPHALCPLSNCGEIVEAYILDIPNHYNNVIVDRYVIMADHLHMILIILPDDNGRLIIAPTISRVVKQMKAAITKNVGFSLWQRSFFDHVIRNRDDYKETCKYIYENPLKWAYEMMFKDGEE